MLFSLKRKKQSNVKSLECCCITWKQFEFRTVCLTAKLSEADVLVVFFFFIIFSLTNVEQLAVK